MDSFATLNGETRVIAIVGDPIAQVKSPAGVTRELNVRGHNAVVIPIHCTSADLERFLSGAAVAKNFDGIIATVPHKFAAYGHCATASDRAHFLGAANILRRNADRSWHGDMVDGLGFVAAARSAGGDPSAQRALLVGAGGAGSAIALALLDAGVARLDIHDSDSVRRDTLVARLATRFGGKVGIGSADPAGYSFVANATPAGMRPGDGLPVDIGGLTKEMFVGDVITVPAVSPLIEAARVRGCRTQTGVGMFASVLELMVNFLLEDGPLVR